MFAAPEGYYDDWERTAEAICTRINLIDRIARPVEARPTMSIPAIDVTHYREIEKEEIPF